MKINTLLKREPFEEIFEKTISMFLEDLTGNHHKVTWVNNDLFKPSSNSGQLWYCNPLINSLFVKGVSPKVFESINGEYLNNPLRPWRSAFQRFYLLLSQFPATSVLMSKYRVSISPPIENAKTKLIIGGNTKIRVIDIVNRTVYVILKSGFDESFLEKDIYVRSNFPYLPMPKVYEHGGNGLWYREEYVSGVSPNRMKKEKSRLVLLQSIKHIHRMLCESKRKEVVMDYALALHGRILSGLNSLSYLDENLKKGVLAISLALIRQLEQYAHYSIDIAYCHGDFHQGNILSSKDNFWILDWEHSGYRQIGYDLFVLLLESRMESQYASRFSRFFDSQWIEGQKYLMKGWPGLDGGEKLFQEMYLAIFLLEEISFQVDEKNNRIFFRDSNVLANYYREWKVAVVSSDWDISID